MKSIEYHQGIIRVFDYLVENGGDKITCATATELAGDHWPEIADLFASKGAGVVSTDGDFIPTNGHRLNPICADSRFAVKEIEKAEHDRELANREKLENIKYGKKGYRLAWVAIVISLSALAVEIIQGI